MHHIAETARIKNLLLKTNDCLHLREMGDKNQKKIKAAEDEGYTYKNIFGARGFTENYSGQ